ncbi:MAG: hypothetical protein AAGA15_14605 [Pseudomonadota bacterium]
MRVKIAGKAFQAEPYDLLPFDPENIHKIRDPDSSGLLFDANPVKTRLARLEKRKIYEYNCMTGREGTFGLDRNGKFAVGSELHVYATREDENYGSYGDLRPGTTVSIDGKKSEQARAKFHDGLGIKPAYGQKGAHDAFRKAAAKVTDTARMTLNWQAVKAKHAPQDSFVVYALVEFTYLRVKINLGVQGSIVILAVPERIHLIVEVTHNCYGDDAEELVMSGDYAVKARPIVLKFPDGSSGALVTGEHRKRREEIEKERKRREAADKLEKAKEKAKDAQKDVEAIERRLKEAKERAEEAKRKAEELEGESGESNEESEGKGPKKG